jgi:hypothetical protein
MGISLAGVTVILPASGAKVEFAISAPIPCFHAGGGAAAAGAGVAAAFGFSGGAVAQPAKMATKGATTHKDEINLTPLFVEFLDKFMLFLLSSDGSKMTYLFNHF